MEALISISIIDAVSKEALEGDIILLGHVYSFVVPALNHSLLYIHKYTKKFARVGTIVAWKKYWNKLE